MSMKANLAMDWAFVYDSWVWTRKVYWLTNSARTTESLGRPCRPAVTVLTFEGAVQLLAP